MLEELIKYLNLSTSSLIYLISLLLILNTISISIIISLVSIIKQINNECLSLIDNTNNRFVIIIQIIKDYLCFKTNHLVSFHKSIKNILENNNFKIDPDDMVNLEVFIKDCQTNAKNIQKMFDKINDVIQDNNL